MVAGSPISPDMPENDWLEALRRIALAHGSFSDVGADHSAIFVEKEQDVLFVSFETMLGIRSTSETGLPFAFNLCERKAWSHMTIMAHRQSWFRDADVYELFDRLTDNGFFDQFDRVIFYGAGMCGFAAGVFSVCAPGSSALLIAPQATLEPTRSRWDTRFPTARRLPFTDRYVDAARLTDGNDATLVVYDPGEVEDAMHASLFRSPQVIHHRYRRGSAGALEADLRGLSLVSKLVDHAAHGNLTRASVARVLRARRRHVPYLRALLSRVLAEDRPRLTQWLCRAVLAEQNLPRFQQHLEQAELQLGLRDADTTAPDASQRSNL